MSFSERYGFKPVRNTLQSRSIDTPLRNSLWNVLLTHLLSLFENLKGFEGHHHPQLPLLIRWLWLDYFKEPIDEMPSSWPPVQAKLKKHCFACEWFEIYDLLQAVAEDGPDWTGERIPIFIEACNNVLKREMSGWRFVDRALVPLPSEHEIAAIEAALAATAASAPLNLVNTHLKQGLTLLADRTAPDFRNSMKESISAVECICKLIAGTPNATLGPALDRIKAAGKVSLHPALEEGFRKLYSYTSDASGIRHALKDAPTVDLEDAKFMLVSCAGFVSYLVDKAIKAGITF